MMLVSLKQANDHLRRDTTDDDADLELKVMAASAAVITYLGAAGAAFLDSSGEVHMSEDGCEPAGVPFDVQAAVLMLVGILYRVRDGEGIFMHPEWETGYLPPTVTALLYPYRKPAMA